MPIDLMPAVFLAFLSGLIVKTVDWLDDERKSKTRARYLLGALYGIVIGYIISVSTFSMIFLAALIAQVFARKIDTSAHRIGFLAAALSILYFGFPGFEPALFAFFAILSFLDEIDYIGRLRPLTEYRLILKIGALIPAIWGVWDYFAGIIAFDAGYMLIGAIARTIAARAGSQNSKPAIAGKTKPITRNPKLKTHKPFSHQR